MKIRTMVYKLKKLLASEQTYVNILYLLGISGAGIDADSQVEKPMRLQVKE